MAAVIQRLAIFVAIVLFSGSLYVQVMGAIPRIASAQATPFLPRLGALASVSLLLGLGLAYVHRKARSAGP